MALQVLIDGVDRTELIDPWSLEVEDAIGERSVCRFLAKDLTGDLASVLVPGETVELILDGVKVFGGEIDCIQRLKPTEAPTPATWYQIECVDWHCLADRRIVAEAYQNMPCGDIVSDLLEKYLHAEGIMGTRKQPAFTRNSVAYLSDGTQVAANVPRFEPGKFAQAIMTEEGTTNLIKNASFEVYTGTNGVADGWSSYTTSAVTASYSVDTTTYRPSGAKSQRVNITASTGYGFALVRQDIAVTAGATYYVSGYVKGSCTGSGHAYVRVTWLDSAGAIISEASPVAVAPTASFTRVGAAVTAPTGAVTLRIGYGCRVSVAGDTADVYWDDVQVEAKTYPTSIIFANDTTTQPTRSAETLTIPTAGVFTKGNWTKEFTFIPTSTQVVTGKTGYLWDLYIDANNYYCAKVGPDGKPYLEVKSNGTVYQTATTSAPVLAVGTNYSFALRGNGSLMALFVNGTKISEVSYVEPVGTLPANQYLGCDHNGANHANGKFDDYRASSKARTDAEISAAYQSGVPLEWDEWTTYKLAFDGNLDAQTPIAQGPDVAEAVFNYVPTSRCLDALAERAGFSWWIDAYKVLHFVERSAYAASFVLQAGRKYRNLQVVRSREGYRNRQYIKAGKDVTDPQIEVFAGDGNTRTFTVGYPIAKVPTVEVGIAGGAWTAQTVGIKGIDTGKQWYWNKGDPVITQDSTGTPLTSADKLRVTYQGFFDIVVLITDEAAISERKSVEGGTGWYEVVDDEPDLSSLEAAIQWGNAKLRRYAKFPKQITFETWETGLRPGQILTVDVPDLGLVNEDFLIEEVRLSWLGGAEWVRQVKAVSGEAVGGWARFFKNLATRGQAWVIRENIREEQVLVVLVQASEQWSWAETSAVSVFACPIPSASLYPDGTSLFPC